MHVPPSKAARSLLVKPAAGDCNLHCHYCFYHERPTDPYKDRGRHRMSDEVLTELIRQGMALNPEHATFGWQGGEPTLMGLAFFERVVALQQEFGRPGQSVSNGLQTNGTLLDGAWARFLRDYRFLVGLSLDGPAAYHDAYRHDLRGEGTQARVMQTARLLRRYRAEFNVLTVLNDVSAAHAVELYDYFVGQGFTYLQFIPCVEPDPETGGATGFSVSSQQFGDAMCALFDRWYNGGNPRTSVRDFDAILAAYVGQTAPMCCYQHECGNYLVVEHNGDVYPCDFFVRKDLYVGNLMETPLEELFETEVVRAFAAAKSHPRPECQACPWLHLCQQGCPRFVGIGGVPRHHLCEGYQQFFAYSQAGFERLADMVLQRQQEASAAHPRASVGRNDPCPCGSGLKYKQCCGRRS